MRTRRDRRARRAAWDFGQAGPVSATRRGPGMPVLPRRRGLVRSQSERRDLPRLGSLPARWSRPKRALRQGAGCLPLVRRVTQAGWAGSRVYSSATEWVPTETSHWVIAPRNVPPAMERSHPCTLAYGPVVRDHRPLGGNLWGARVSAWVQAEEDLPERRAS